MFLGALIDLGLERELLVRDLAGLGLPHEIVVKRVQRGALAARYVEVRVPEVRARRVRGPAQARRGRRPDGHAHADGHGHAHADGGHGRRFAELRALLEQARLAEPVRARALDIFGGLAEAEARVHGIAVDDVHFHEVGAVDAIVDVVGAAAGLQRLGVARVTASPLALGHGSVETQHGRLPLPAPAVLELLRGIPTVPAHVAWETVTPTGAAIARAVVDAFGPLPAMTVERIGHGAGDVRRGPMPNVLRAVLGRQDGTGADRVAVLETNLDDLVPEHFEHLMERLFEAGALDVSLATLQMKKNRPGFLVRVIARPSERDRLARLVLTESTAIGVRFCEWDRWVLAREVRRVPTPYGPVDVKVVRRPDGSLDASPEYEACRRRARERQVPIRDVARAAEQAARQRLGEVGPQPLASRTRTKRSPARKRRR
jgi:hypothetical protein